MINHSVFHPIVKSALGFRECSILIKIAHDTDTYIEVIANNRTGSSDSILSLVQLGITANTSIIFTITGANQIKCCHLLMELFDNGWQPEYLEQFTPDNHIKKYKISIKSFSKIRTITNFNALISLPEIY